MAEETTLTVGLVAKRCGVKVSTLHFYEQKGLIRSWRNQGNQRRYKKDVLRRVSIIKAAQKAGISLEQVAAALAKLPANRTPNDSDWQQLAATWRDELSRKITYLTQLRSAFDCCIGCGCLSLKKCPIYNQDDKLAQQGAGAVLIEQGKLPAE